MLEVAAAPRTRASWPTAQHAIRVAECGWFVEYEEELIVVGPVVCNLE